MPLKTKIDLLIYLMAFALSGICSFRSHAYMYCEVRRQLTAFSLYHLSSSQLYMLILSTQMIFFTSV